MMIVPRYWAEGRLVHRDESRQVTVRRFGWSDASLEEAQASADERTRAALGRILAGEELPRREPKIPYNGADGVPIREEIVSEHGDAVVTRNSYGALCLNTPDVLFGDVDPDDELPNGVLMAEFLTVVATVLTTFLVVSPGVKASASAMALSGCMFLVILGNLVWKRRAGLTFAARAVRRVESFVAAHPGWKLNLYRTPAGFRVLALHRTFDPRGAEAARFFKALKCDPMYVRMCLRQHCFRARVSPKPWRVGIKDHLRPRPGVWPVKEEHLPARRRWAAAYEAASRGYSSCRFVAAFGSGAVDPKAEAVRELHDGLCRAESDLPMA